ncbi:hypothetical protein RDWZM_004606, partial [Blomia tropicalis]
EPANSASCEMRDKAYEICRKYLSGEWNNISSDDMVFKTVSGGLSNLLYYCSLPSTHTPVTGEPSQVLLRMYGQLLEKNDTKITDSVITMLLSERNLGPKLYGIFPGGRLEEYIPARAMVCKELKELKYAAIIARKLATVHHLNVPINKDPTWLYDTLKRWLKQVRDYKHECVEKIPQLEKELLEFDFEGEFDYLTKLFSLCGSPIVFAHNDLQEGNILLPSGDITNCVQMNNTKSLELLDDHIVFIDFEFCAYNYRGFDLGNHFCERMFDYSNPEWPHYYADLNEYPDDEAKLYFIREYLKQSNEIKEAEEMDTEDHLLKEAEFYALASHFLWTLWSINNARTSKIAFGYLEYGKTRVDAYQKHKQYLTAKYKLGF